MTTVYAVRRGQTVLFGNQFLIYAMLRWAGLKSGWLDMSVGVHIVCVTTTVWGVVTKGLYRAKA